VQWKDLFSLPQGGYEDYDADLHSNMFSASNMLRISPRQVTLAAGERQVIKLLARRSSKFSEAEYRSHLNFVVIPAELSNEDDAPSDGVNMKLNLFMNYSIPVVLRNEQPQIDIQIKNTKLMVNNEQNRYDMKVDFSRKGNTSYVGNISVYALERGSDNKSLVGQLNAINMFAEHNEYTRTIALVDYDASASDNLIVEIKGANEFSNNEIARKEHNR
jgi:hypothetical protein